MDPNRTPGQDALAYHPSKVSWAAAEFIRKPPALAVLVFPSLLGVLLASVLLYSFFTKVPVAIDAGGVLVTEQAPLPMIAPSSATVVELRVHENDEIRKGQILVVTDNDISDVAFTELKRTVEELSGLIARDRKGHCEAACVNRMQTMAGSAFRQTIPQAARDNVLQVLELLNDFVNAKNNVLRSGVLTAEQRREIDVAKTQLQTIRQRHAEVALATDVEQLKSKIGGLQGEIHQSFASARNTAEQARNRLDVRLGDLLTRVGDFRGAQAIKAPSDGFVTGLAISGVGQKLSQGQQLLAIVPKDSPLVAELEVQNKDIARVTKGLGAKLRLEALPEREFGAIAGTVAVIPAAPAHAPGEAKLPTFKVRVTLDAQKIVRNRIEYPLRFGMTLSAMIVTERQRLLTLGVKKMLNLKDALTGDE